MNIPGWRSRALASLKPLAVIEAAGDIQALLGRWEIRFVILGSYGNVAGPLWARGPCRGSRGEANGGAATDVYVGVLVATNE